MTQPRLTALLALVLLLPLAHASTYTFFAGFIGAGSDVGSLPAGTALADAQAWCDARPECVALTYEGPREGPASGTVYLKNRTGELVPNASSPWSTWARADPTATWHAVWIGGQSNSVGTNSQTTGYPVWPTTTRIQSFCWGGQHGCATGTFAPSAVPLPGESNVGFAQTYANLLLQTLPDNHGVVLVNTGVGGTGFHGLQWSVPDGPLAVQSVKVVQALAAAFPAGLGGNLSFHSMLWHQAEQDAGDNGDQFHADYCTYLVDDLSALIDFLRAGFPGASPTTPFIDGGLLPYWQDLVPGGIGGVTDAIYALNTSRACTATADSRIFRDFKPDGTPNGDPNFRSGVSGMVIHFDATQAVRLGFEYFDAYLRALNVTSVVPSDATKNCAGSVPQAPVASCGS